MNNSKNELKGKADKYEMLFPQNRSLSFLCLTAISKSVCIWDVQRNNFLFVERHVHTLSPQCASPLVYVYDTGYTTVYYRKMLAGAARQHTISNPVMIWQIISSNDTH
jgi:hypothetical protein